MQPSIGIALSDPGWITNLAPQPAVTVTDPLDRRGSQWPQPAVTDPLDRRGSQRPLRRPIDLIQSLAGVDVEPSPLVRSPPESVISSTPEMDNFLGSRVLDSSDLFRLQRTFLGMLEAVHYNSTVTAIHRRNLHSPVWKSCAYVSIVAGRGDFGDTWSRADLPASHLDGMSL